MPEQQWPQVSRVGRNVFVWGLMGSTGGLVLGVLAGLAFATPGRFGFWMVVIGTTIFVGAICAFTAGIASLEVPPPGDEPTEAGASPTER